MVNYIRFATVLCAVTLFPGVCVPAVTGWGETENFPGVSK